MTTTNEFKETELGEIPVEWEIDEIGESCIINENGANPAKDFPNKKFNYIDISNVESGGSGRILDVKEIEGKEAPSRARRVVSEGDVIMSTVRPYLKSYAIIPKEYNNEICSTGYAVLNGKEKLRNDFLFYSLLSKSLQNQFNKVMRGANYPALNKSHVSSTLIPIPPLPEQKAIAQKLTVIRNAIEQTQAVIEATEALKKSMMKHLFTYGPVPASQTDQVELKETDIGLVPKEWEIKEMGELVDLIGGYAFRSKNFVESSNTQLIRMGNLYNNRLDLDRNPVFLPDNYFEDNLKYQLKEGDLILSLTGTMGKEDYGYAVKIPDINSNLLLNQRVAKISSNNDALNKDFLYYFLLTRKFLDHLYNSAKGTKQANVSMNSIRSIPICLPPIEIQKRISSYLNLITEKVINEQDNLISLNKLFDSALSELMSAKIRVN